jgi:phosphate transport system substrate-binding protein
MDELAMVFSNEATMWSDINADWPAEEIELYAPGTDSGTFDFFVEIVFDEDEAPMLEANPQLSEDDNVLVQGVLGSPYAIGFFGYAYYQENEGNLKALALDGIEPTEETAEDNSYPLSRPLFIYSAASIMQEKPQVASFINYYLTTVNEEIIDVGYFPASATALNNARSKWLNAMGE